MGVYRSLLRPAFFLLPPETAHRVAGAALRLPLPWRAIGNPLQDPLLRTDLAGLPLRNPIGLAAGFDKDGRWLQALTDLGFGYVVAGTVTRRPRGGNSRPRIVRRPETASLVNAMGLPNEGAARVAGRIGSKGRQRSGPVILSVADEEIEDVVATHRLAEGVSDGVELNASCPNVSWGRDRDTEEHLRSLLRALRNRRKPLFVKLPPYRTDRERDAVLALARLAVEEGAQGLTCFNSVKVPEPGLSVGAGGLTGRELLHGTIRGVAEVVRAVEGAVPINACGGISRGADAAATIDAGATTVQLYTGLIYEGPGIVGDLTRHIARARRSARVSAPEATTQALAT